MRNHVSKMLVGEGVAFTAIASLTEGKIVSMDLDTRAAVTSNTKNIVFVKGTSVLGEPLITGPMSVKDIQSAVTNPYTAAVSQKSTLTVGTVPSAGKTAIFKVVYIDNLSIVPNQIKQTAISVTAVSGETTSTFATKIAAEFNKQDYLFVTVTSASAIVTFEAKVLLTRSNYNRIDRPETLTFELGAPDEFGGTGVYTVARTLAPKLGQGDPANIAWLEDRFQGRFGFSDRRSWNDGKKFNPSVDPTKNYDTIVINANSLAEGDMQGVRSNPIGVILAITDDTPTGAGLFYEQLALAVSLTEIPG
jgi:hypothetical protein